jgi:hypothetical protein
MIKIHFSNYIYSSGTSNNDKNVRMSIFLSYISLLSVCYNEIRMKYLQLIISILLNWFKNEVLPVKWCHSFVIVIFEMLGRYIPCRRGDVFYKKIER